MNAEGAHRVRLALHRPRTHGERDDVRALKRARDEQHSRLRNALIDLAIVAVLIFAAIKLHSSFSGIGDALEKASPGPIVAAVGLEVCSELGFVLAFLLVMDPERELFSKRRLGRQIAWTELGGGMLLPAGAAGGPAIAAWALSKLGVAGELIAQRSLVLLFLNSAVNFAAVIFFGVAMYLGVLAGSTDPLLTLLPAAVAFAVLVAVLLVPKFVLPLARRSARTRPKFAVVLETVGCAVLGTIAELRGRNWRLLGPVAYWALDNAVLYLVFVALGHTPPVGVVALGYLVGALGGSIPLPAGIGSILGMAGFLVAFGVPTGEATAAVLAYQAISIGVATIGGTVAYLFLRRNLEHPELRAGGA